MEDILDTSEGTHRGPDGQRWSREELSFLGAGVLALVLWAVLTVAFGYGGFIFVALALVAAVFVALVLVSRG